MRYFHSVKSLWLLNKLSTILGNFVLKIVTGKSIMAEKLSGSKKNGQIEQEFLAITVVLDCFYFENVNNRLGYTKLRPEKQ